MKKQNHNKINQNLQVKKLEEMTIKTIYFDEIDSTNDWAKMHLEQWNARGLTVVSANYQSSGRGRHNRSWFSPKNVNCYISICFLIDENRLDIGQIPQLLALCCAKVLATKNISIQIKWPNDLMINAKKIGGILCETILHGDKRGIVCGLGLNVNTTREMLDQINQRATSLFVETDILHDTSEVINQVVASFKEHLQLFLLESFKPFFSSFLTYLFFKNGDAIQFHDHSTVVKGIFKTLNSDGSVTLQLNNGTFQTYHAGEFTI